MYKIFADFNNCDALNRVRLNTNGAKRDIQEGKIKLEKGMKVLLDDEDGLTICGVIDFSEIENVWVAKVEWDKHNHL